MKWLLKTFGRFWYLYLIGIMAAGFLFIALGKKQLNVYRPGIDGSDYTVITEKQTEKNVPMEAYKCDGINMVMQVPQGWERVTKDGFDTFVHSASATSLQIQVLDYYPEINNEDADYLSASLAKRGYSIVDYRRTAANNYYVEYQNSNDAGVTDYITDVIWDREHVVKIAATVNDKNYDGMETAIWNCFNSVEWECESPIAEGFVLVYQMYGDFEYAVPASWTYEETGGAAYAADSETGASLTVTLNESDVTIDQISQIDYSSMLGDGLQNYQLKGFSQHSDHIHGEATYYSNDTEFAVMQDLYANGKYLYAVTYEFPSVYTDTYYNDILAGMGMTRIFYDPETEETEASSEKDHSEDHSFTIPDGSSSSSDSSESQSETVSEKESETSALSLSSMAGDLEKETSPSSEKQDPASSGSSEPSSEDRSSTLAGALVTVAGIDEGSAAKIENIWKSLSLGTPVYADGYADTGSVSVVLVQTDMKVNYYLFIDLDTGTLQKITVNTDDGQVVYQDGQ